MSNKTETEKPARRNRCFGGIIYCSNTAETAETAETAKTAKAVEKRYLLVKGRQTGIWSFPKGHSTDGESSLECAKREIYEETGIQLVEEHRRVIRLKGGVYFVFQLTDIPQHYPTDTREIEETRWLTKEEMPYLIVNSGVKDFLQRNI